MVSHLKIPWQGQNIYHKLFRDLFDSPAVQAFTFIFLKKLNNTNICRVNE